MSIQVDKLPKNVKKENKNKKRYLDYHIPFTVPTKKIN